MVTEWTAQVNDTIGGWIVTTYPRPDSEQLYRDVDGVVKAHGYIIAECRTQHDACEVAILLNKQGLER